MNTELLQITQEEAAHLIDQLSRKMRNCEPNKLLEREIGSLLVMLIALMQDENIDENEVMLSMHEKVTRIKFEMTSPPDIDLTQLGI